MSRRGLELTREDLRGRTAAGLLVARARATPDATAFRSKHLGIYRERTWREYAELVARAAAALRDLGVKAGERVAIMGDPCEEWIICDLAAQSLGAISYGIYPTASVAELEYQMRDGAAAVFIAEDQEYVDKISAIADKLPALRAIVVIDDSALFDYPRDRLFSYDKLLEAVGRAELDQFASDVSKLSPDAPAFIVYTSGTTGNPKGALVTHGSHLAATHSVVTQYPTLADKDHRTVVYLPLCHVLGRDVAVTLPLISRLVPHFGESIEDLPTTLFETAPTVLFTVPRYLQKFASQVLVGIQHSSSVKRASYRIAMRFAAEHARRRWAGAKTTREALDHALHVAVFHPILNKLGFDKLELVVSTGAPLPAGTMALWHMYGINVCEMYGQTETAGGIVSGQRGPFPRPGNVGTVVEGSEVKLADDGEILVRSPDLFDRYWNNEEATRSVLGPDGWLRTGDVGAWEGNALKLVDRARDFIVTSGGKTISPAFIEGQLRASPYVAEAVVFGHGRKYLCALIEIDFDTVSDWARSQNVNYSGFSSLAQNSLVERLIRSEIEKANTDLARVEQIKAFRILPKALDPEEDSESVTPTRKIKRMQMNERFRQLIESMYDDYEERLIAAGAEAALRA